MTTTNATRFSAHGALLISLLSLGLATWAVGCEQQPRDASESQKSAEPAAPKTNPEQTPDETSDPKTKKAKGKTSEPKPKTTGKKSKTGEVETPKAKTVGARATSLPKLKRLVVTTGVQKREPLKVDTLLAGEDPIYAFMELTNESTRDHYVVVTFEREDDLEVVGHIKLKVPAQQPRWRTWGRTHMIQDAGPWVAVVRTPDGHELAREPFDVLAS